MSYENIKHIPFSKKEVLNIIQNFINHPNKESISELIADYFDDNKRGLKNLIKTILGVPLLPENIKVGNEYYVKVQDLAYWRATTQILEKNGFKGRLKVKIDEILIKDLNCYKVRYHYYDNDKHIEDTYEVSEASLETIEDYPESEELKQFYEGIKNYL